MVSTAGLIRQAAPGSIPGRSSRDGSTHRCEAVKDVVTSVGIKPAVRVEAHEAPQQCGASFFIVARYIHTFFDTARVLG